MTKNMPPLKYYIQLVCHQLTNVAGDPCLNYGVCVPTGHHGNRCYCVPGFTGATCQTNLDDCAGQHACSQHGFYLSPPMSPSPLSLYPPPIPLYPPPVNLPSLNNHYLPPSSLPALSNPPPVCQLQFNPLMPYPTLPTTPSLSSSVPTSPHPLSNCSPTTSPILKHCKHHID